MSTTIEEVSIEVEELEVKSTESYGMHTFDRIGRPVVVFDQRSNQNTSILLEWNKHVDVWKSTQVEHINKIS